MYSVSINKSYTDLLKKIRLHLSVIGKRAVNVQGESFYVELTTSSKEDKVFYDLIDAAGETLVSELSDVSSSYSNESSITFVIRNDRWEKSDETFKGNLEKALEQSIERYFVNFSLAQFLSAIFPALKETSAPMYGKPYIDHCQVIIKNIKTLAYLKRPDAECGSTYGEMLDANGDYFDDGKIISLLTIKRNGEPVVAYNGTADKVANIVVPTKLSELSNDKSYITGISDEMVIDALGYTPLNATMFNKDNVLSLSGIYPWALKSTKPSYTASEISGLSDLLGAKYDKSSFVTDFARELSKVYYVDSIEALGSGDYVTGIIKHTNSRKIYYKLGSLSQSVTSIVTPLINNAISGISTGGSGGSNVTWGSGGTNSKGTKYVVLNVEGETKNLMTVEAFNEFFFKKDGNIGTSENLYSSKGITAYGIGSSGSGEGGSGSGSSVELGNLLTTLNSQDPSLPSTKKYLYYDGTAFGFGDGGTTVSWGAESNGYATLLGKSVALSGHTHNYQSPLTESQLAVLNSGITAETWSDVYDKRHNHSNKEVIDLLTQDMINVLGKLSLDGGKLKISCDTYSTGGISAYGKGDDASQSVSQYFYDLLDVKSAGTTPDANLAWGIKSVSDGAPVYDWIEVGIKSLEWGKITGKPNTIAGYGITDALTQSAADGRYLQLSGGTLTGNTEIKTQNGSAYFSVTKVNENSISIYSNRVEYSQNGGGNLRIYLDYIHRTGPSGDNKIYYPSNGGTLALTSDNVASATKLKDKRKLWGNDFDGTANVNGTIVFPALGTWPPTEGEEYPLRSNGLTWSGESDCANIYFELYASNNGRLVLDVEDDGEEAVAIAHNKTVYHSFGKHGITIGNGNKTVTLSVDSAGNLKIDNSDSKANVYATGGITAYGVGDDDTKKVNNFYDLNDYVTPSATDANKAWGIVSVDSNNKPTFGWIEAGKTYVGSTYIDVTGTTIGVKFDALKSAITSGYATQQWVGENYAPKVHSHSQYITKNGDASNASYIASRSDNWNDFDTAGYYKVNWDGQTAWNNAPNMYKYGMMEVLRLNSDADSEQRVAQVYYPHNVDDYSSSCAIAVRMRNQGGWSNWNYIPTTNGTIANADKLATTRYLWGQSFDGSGNVNGTITFNGGGKVIDATNNSVKINNKLWISDETNGSVWITASGGRAQIGLDNSGEYVSILGSNGNVGIGVTAPTEKLEINGNAKALMFIGDLQGSADKVDGWHKDDLNTVAGYMSHDLAAFCNYTTPTYEYTTDGTNWQEGSLSKNLFANCWAWNEIINDTIIGSQWTWHFYVYTNISKIILAPEWASIKAAVNIIFQTSSDGVTWTDRATYTEYSQAEYCAYNVNIGSDSYLRIRIVRTSADGSMVLTGIRILSPRPGAQAKSMGYDYPFIADGNRHIYPWVNNESYLGIADNRWKGVYACSLDVAGNAVLGGDDATYLQIGNARIQWDATNNALKVVYKDGVSACNLYAVGGVSAYGIGKDGEETAASNFYQLSDVAETLKTNPSANLAWGIASKNGDTPVFGWIEAGKTYGGSTYIGVNGTVISLDSQSANAWNAAYNHSLTSHAPSDAQKNVQSDWNATSGDALILNKPTIPTTLPASDVYPWAKAENKPSYTTSEVSEGTNKYFTDARAQSALSGHTGNTTIHITADERTTWNNKWDYNADTIRAVKVKNAENADKATEADSADIASKLNTHSLWGQDFNGEDNVSGDIIGAAGGVNIEITNEINCYNGHLYLNHRGNGSGYNGGTTNNIIALANGGNFGIGTTSPQCKLDVYGNSHISEQLSINASAASGYYLTTTNAIIGGDNNNGSNRIQLRAGVAELYAPTPFINFHYGNSGDYNYTRLINDASGRLSIYDTNNKPSIRLGDAIISYDNNKKLLTISDDSGDALNLVTTGAMTAYGLTNSAEIGTLTQLNLTSRLSIASWNLYNDNGDLYVKSNYGSVYLQNSVVFDGELLDVSGVNNMSVNNELTVKKITSTNWSISDTGNCTVKYGRITDNIKIGTQGSGASQNFIQAMWNDGTYLYIKFGTSTSSKTYKFQPVAIS